METINYISSWAGTIRDKSIVWTRFFAENSTFNHACNQYNLEPRPWSTEGRKRVTEIAAESQNAHSTLQVAKKAYSWSVVKPASRLSRRRPTPIVHVWAEVFEIWNTVSSSIVTCKCMRPDPVTGIAVTVPASAESIQMGSDDFQSLWAGLRPTDGLRGWFLTDWLMELIQYVTSSPAFAGLIRPCHNCNTTIVFQLPRRPASAGRTRGIVHFFSGPPAATAAPARVAWR